MPGYSVALRACMVSIQGTGTGETVREAFLTALGTRECLFAMVVRSSRHVVPSRTSERLGEQTRKAWTTSRDETGQFDKRSSQRCLRTGRDSESSDGLARPTRVQ